LTGARDFPILPQWLRSAGSIGQIHHPLLSIERHRKGIIMTENKTPAKKATAAPRTATTAAAKAPAKAAPASPPTAAAAAAGAAETVTKAPATRKAATATAENKSPAKQTAAAPATASDAPQPAATAPVEGAAPVETAAPVEAAPAAPAVARPSAEERYRMVESAAYFIAEKDGFQGCATHYWTLAEREIAVSLGETEA